MALFRIRHGSSVQWAVSTRILQPGELGVDTTTHQMKVGDGIHHWDDLDYFLPHSELVSTIQQLVDDAIDTIDASEAVTAAINAHINSSTPHPVYDDGPSLVLLYANAKV